MKTYIFDAFIKNQSQTCFESPPKMNHSPLTPLAHLSQESESELEVNSKAIVSAGSINSTKLLRASE